MHTPDQARAIVSRETTGASPPNDPIAAIATAPGRGGVGVVRVSGGNLETVVAGLVGRALTPRVATLVKFQSDDGHPLDEGIALWFQAPASFTGESVLELQGHGSPQGLQAVLRRCLSLGCRLARPGEFTERAFLNGRLDLAQAEAVADLIEASSEQAARSAARTLTGDFSRRVHQLVDAVTRVRMHIEASIDFPEEEIDPADADAMVDALTVVQGDLATLMREARQGAVLRDGLNVVLMGRPNVGKSSLLNCLAGDELAIVTPVPGTTRDPVRTTIHIEGVPIHLIDTAGLRETDDPVERIGIERTWDAIGKAGAAILLVEAGEMAGRGEAEILARLPKGLPLAWVTNKIDLYQGRRVSRETQRDGAGVSLSISALTGEGIDDLRDWLLATAGWIPGHEGVFLARERHLQALAAARDHLAMAGHPAGRFELFAEELRLAQRALSMITGEFTADDLLGEIFSRFCIGK
jgi:tRNA modification GTPase